MNRLMRWIDDNPAKSIFIMVFTFVILPDIIRLIYIVWTQ